MANNKDLNRNGDRRGMSLNSQKNLRGVQGIGNPKNNHAQKNISLTRIARDKLALPCPYDKDKTWAEYIVERWLSQAVENATYFRELMDRLEGKVLQPIGGDEDKPLYLNIQVKDKETKQLLQEIINE